MELSPVPMWVSRSPKNVSLVRGRRVLRFVMAEGTWDSTGACEPTLKLMTDQKGSRSLRFSLSPYLTLFLTLSFTPVAAEPGKPLVCQSAPRFRRELSFLVVASRQVLDGCRWSALLCQRFTSSRRCSLLVRPPWKVSDWEVRRVDAALKIIALRLCLNATVFCAWAGLYVICLDIHVAVWTNCTKFILREVYASYDIKLPRDTIVICHMSFRICTRSALIIYFFLTISAWLKFILKF